MRMTGEERTRYQPHPGSKEPALEAERLLTFRVVTRTLPSPAG